MNLPQFFTLLRIFISPAFPLLYLKHEVLGLPLIAVPYLLLTLLIICESSDLFDGFLARRRNQVTDVGKVLDPMADSIAHISLFLTFTQGIVQLPLLLVFVFLYRDLFIGALRTICALRGVALGARTSGKAKTVIQGGAAFLILILMIPCLMGWISLELFQQLSFAAASLAALCTVAAVGDYLYANRIHIKKAFV
ncbi:MAG: CDP-alcohol phosphatidyltransferase family protein [Chlamydiia bacterium]|nr:CDP-alcohol phosphatidyltransferase family protein [Chlamydiia bacterium]